jgi:hypothetical protein
MEVKQKANFLKENETVVLRATYYFEIAFTLPHSGGVIIILSFFYPSDMIRFHVK